MEFLKMLESIRTPFLDTFMSIITYAGSTAIFLVVAIVFFWCVDKKHGYYLFTVGLIGTVISQFLKVFCRIPRPWVKDPSFTIVESARAGATGYSFPSGHTQSTVCCYGSIFMISRKKWLKALCVILMLVVPFSRMYLGVHTPWDVGVSFVLGLILVIGLYPCFKTEDRFKKCAPWLLGGFFLLSAAYLGFVLLYNFPSDLDPVNYQEGMKNAFSLTGASLGLFISYLVDRKALRFSTEAPVIGQILKVVLGIALMLVLKSVLKAPLNMLFAGTQIGNAVRYFLMVIFAGCIWPLTFPLFAKLGKKKN